jgi:hypothetical protein
MVWAFTELVVNRSTPSANAEFPNASRKAALLLLFRSARTTPDRSASLGGSRASDKTCRRPCTASRELPDTATKDIITDGAHELTGRHRVDRVLARKQPSLRPRCPPPLAQECEQLRGEHHVPVPLLLPCSTRNVMRRLSILDTFRAASSDARRPAP